MPETDYNKIFGYMSEADEWDQTPILERGELFGKEAPSIGPDSETQEFLDFYNGLDKKLSSQTKDYLVQYWLNERSSQKAFQRELDASSQNYQRTVKDLTAAGLSPYLAFQGLSGSSPNSSAGSVSGGLFTSRANSKASNTTSAISSSIGTVLSILALIMLKTMFKK